MILNRRNNSSLHPGQETTKPPPFRPPCYCEKMASTTSTYTLNPKTFYHEPYHYGLLGPKNPYKDPIKGRLRYP